MKVNGKPVPILAAAALPRTPRPVVGPRRANVVYPLDAPATIEGQYGKAWLCDLSAARRKLLEAGKAKPDSTVAHWIVEAPWSHEVVHSYSLVLIHLRFAVGQPIHRYLPGATHELTLYPIHPAAPRVQMLTDGINPTMWIPPIAFASQIVEPTDEAAAARVRRAMELVCEGRLSPHPDHGMAWAELFGDCMLLQAVAPAEKEASE